MPAKVREVDKMLTGKLDAEREEGAKHTSYRVFHEGTLLATTRLSRSYLEIDDNLLGTIARQLFVNRKQMDLLLQCPWSRQDYVTHRLQAIQKA